MAIGKAEKAAYNDEIKDLKVIIDDYQKLIKDVTLKKKQNQNLKAYYSFEMVTYYMKAIELYLKMSDISVDMLGIKNDISLNEARKNFYLVVQLLEEIVGSEVDRSLRANDDYLIYIDKFDPSQILKFIKKLHAAFEDLNIKVGGAGETSGGSKWRWSFVELQARVAVITKNITNFSDVAKLRDPRTPFYKERKELMDLTMDCLNEAAKQYRTKYELAGKARDDMKKTLELLSSLRKIYVLFGESEEATKLKNVIDAGKQALESEDTAKDKKKKK
jgi:hypothetical protein